MWVLKLKQILGRMKASSTKTIFIFAIIKAVVVVIYFRDFNLLWHFASRLSRWFWSPAGERIHLFLQLRGSLGRASGGRWVESTRCSREAAAPWVSTGFVSLRHQDIDRAAPCLPPCPQTDLSCWSYWRRSHTANPPDSDGRGGAGGILIQAKVEGISGRWECKVFNQWKVALIMDIFRNIYVWVCVREPYWLSASSSPGT